MGDNIQRQFNAWANANDFDIQWGRNSYVDKETAGAWKLWQSKFAPGNCSQCNGTGNFKCTVFNVNFTESPDRPSDDED